MSEQLGVLPLIVSAKDPAALDGQLERLETFVRTHTDVRVRDIAFSLAGRAALEHRAVILGADGAELSNCLSEAIAEPSPGARGGVVRGVVRASGATAFLFTGQGSQRVGMGAELYGASAVFRGALDDACDRLNVLLERSLREVMFGGGDVRVGEDRAGAGAGHRAGAETVQGSLLDQTAFTQAGLFALEIALFRLTESLGLRADYLIGHSVGELAAAHVAGVLSLDDACALVAARGLSMGVLAPGGAMLAVQATEQEGLRALEGLEDRVALAAVNGPESIVLSGDEDALAELAGAWRCQGSKTRRLDVSHAFHSPGMEPMLEEFRRAAAAVSFDEPRIPLVSNLTGEAISAEQLCTPDYWVRHVRNTVRFADGVRWLVGQGVDTFLELGPDGVLSPMVEDCLAGAQASDQPHPGEAVRLTDARALALLRKNRGEGQALMGALAQLWTRGTDVDWRALSQGSDTRLVDLPTYAFQRERYWLEAATRLGPSLRGASAIDHPLLSAVVGLADGEGCLFVGELSGSSPAWVADHIVMGEVVVPGTAFVELALAVCQQLDCDLVEELVMEAPLVLAEGEGVRLQISVDAPEDAGRRSVRIYSGPLGAEVDAQGEEGWTRHASGVLARARASSMEQSALTARASSLAELWPPQDAAVVDVEDFYGAMTA
ncbi:MAG TPA: acyltransferase domain-containing protein, partial [Solirubrobacteraceae bacterium]|nr:acyltransferase domain-containing protein [Solirubrobacteraceae bacterium]